MELPVMGTTHYGTAVAASNQLWMPNKLNALTTGGIDNSTPRRGDDEYRKLAAAMQSQTTLVQPKKETSAMAESTTRLVKVFIVDPNQNVPLEKRLIYRGDETVTDLTDQELFFEIDIAGLLKTHNEYRVTVEDKKANKDKPVMLEAARVRDLKMQVIVLAQF